MEDKDVEEFVRELTEHQEELLLVIRGLCGSADDAPDIRQAVNMVLWRKRKEFRLGSNFRAWAYRVAQFEVRAYFRKKKKQGMVTFSPELLSLIAVELPSVADHLEDRRSALRHCLEGLTPKDAELVRHRYWSGGNLESLASNTGRSVGTLKARLHQLRAKLRDCISRQLSPQPEA